MYKIILLFSLILATLYGLDSDLDGIPDDTEDLLLLNKNDHRDAHSDLDQDNFSNLHEFLQGSSISDKDNFPLLSNFLKINKVIQGDKIPITFHGTLKNNGKISFVLSINNDKKLYQVQLPYDIKIIKHSPPSFLHGKFIKEKIRIKHKDKVITLLRNTPLNLMISGPKIQLYSSLEEKTFNLAKNDEFILKNKTYKQVYKIISFDDKQCQILNITSKTKDILSSKMRFLPAKKIAEQYTLSSIEKLMLAKDNSFLEVKKENKQYNFYYTLKENENIYKILPYKNSPSGWIIDFKYYTNTSFLKYKNNTITLKNIVLNEKNLTKIKQILNSKNFKEKKILVICKIEKSFEITILENNIKTTINL